MKQSLDRIAEIASEKLHESNYKEIARAIWFELNKSKRISAINPLIDKMRRLEVLKQDKVVAKIICAKEPSKEQLEQINEKLEKKFDKKFYLETEIDKSILGGLKIQIDDEVVDLSWQGKLNQLKERLAGEDE